MPWYWSPPRMEDSQPASVERDLRRRMVAHVSERDAWAAIGRVLIVWIGQLQFIMFCARGLGLERPNHATMVRQGGRSIRPRSQPVPVAAGGELDLRTTHHLSEATDLQPMRLDVCHRNRHAIALARLRKEIEQRRPLRSPTALGHKPESVLDQLGRVHMLEDLIAGAQPIPHSLERPHMIAPDRTIVCLR